MQPKPKNPVWFQNTFPDDDTTTMIITITISIRHPLARFFCLFVFTKHGRILWKIARFLSENCTFLATPLAGCAERSRRSLEPVWTRGSRCRCKARRAVRSPRWCGLSLRLSQRTMLLKVFADAQRESAQTCETLGSTRALPPPSPPDPLEPPKEQLEPPTSACVLGDRDRRFVVLPPLCARDFVVQSVISCVILQKVRPIRASRSEYKFRSSRRI